MNSAIDLNTFKLSKGNHKSIDSGGCIMEMVSYLANEPWSDHPKCACPVLTGYAIRLNDHFNDDHRQLMKKFIPLLINTKSTDEIQIARKRLICWRNVTVTYPLILDSLKLPEIANELRTFSNTLTGMEKAKEFLKSNKEKIYIYATDYAYAYAYAKAANAAYATDYAYAYAYAKAANAAYAADYAYAYAYANAANAAYAADYAYAYAYANAANAAYAANLSSADLHYADLSSANLRYADLSSAEALREKIVEVALETLRLAIEIREER